MAVVYPPPPPYGIRVAGGGGGAGLDDVGAGAAGVSVANALTVPPKATPKMTITAPPTSAIPLLTADFTGSPNC